MTDQLKTVLLVDDQEEMIRLMLCLLKREGKYQVLTAPGGEEALAVSRRTMCHIDILITDIDLGTMNGVDLYNCLKQERPFMPALFVSGAAIGFEHQHPDWRLLRKPFSPEAFLTAVSDTMTA